MGGMVDKISVIWSILGMFRCSLLQNTSLDAQDNDQSCFLTDKSGLACVNKFLHVL